MTKPMTLTNLIGALSQCLDQHGDLEITCNEGGIIGVRLTPCVDGASYPIEGDPNEVHIEFDVA